MSSEDFGRLDKRERDLIRRRRRQLRDKERSQRRHDNEEIRDLRRKLNNNDKPHPARSTAHKPTAHGTGAHRKGGRKVHYIEERAVETLRSSKSLAAGETLTITYTLPDKLRFEKITTRGDDDGRLMSIFIGRKPIHRSSNGLALGELKMTNNQAIDFTNVEGDKGDVLTITLQASDKDKTIDINLYGQWLVKRRRHC